jgi:hypothetical protein
MLGQVVDQEAHVCPAALGAARVGGDECRQHELMLRLLGEEQVEAAAADRGGVGLGSVYGAVSSCIRARERWPDPNSTVTGSVSLSAQAEDEAEVLATAVTAATPA